MRGTIGTSVLALLLFASLGHGEESKPQQQQTAPTKRTTSATNVSQSKTAGDSPLVKAAKSAPVNRDKAKIKIDNAAVKKSAGKVSIAPQRPLTELPVEQRNSTIIRNHDQAVAQWQKDVTAAREKVDQLESEVKELEALMGRFEEDFYNEDDPGYRDVLEGKYDSADQRLAKAREELAAAREASNTLQNSKPRLY